MSAAGAERLLADLTAQLNTFIHFLRVDLSPVISAGAIEEDQRAVRRIARGQNSYVWIQRLHEIHHWTNLALWEQDWLQRTGGSAPTPCLGSHRLGTMARFIQEEMLPNNHNTKKALQNGRRLFRFESQFGHGITLLLIPVLPTFRLLTLAEEARAIQKLQEGFASIKEWAKVLANLRDDLQCGYGVYPAVKPYSSHPTCREVAPPRSS